MEGAAPGPGPICERRERAQGNPGGPEVASPDVVGGAGPHISFLRRPRAGGDGVLPRTHIKATTSPDFGALPSAPGSTSSKTPG